MSVRVYVPTTLAGLREVVVSGGVGPSPVPAHAVTDALRTTLAGADDEECEYAAMTAAAQESLALLTDDDVPRRVVIAADAATVVPREAAEPSAVEVPEVLPVRRVAAVHLDSPDAEEDVAAARAALADGDRSGGAEQAVERCLDHELGWFATQEIGDLLEG